MIQLIKTDMLRLKTILKVLYPANVVLLKFKKHLFCYIPWCNSSGDHKINYIKLYFICVTYGLPYISFRFVSVNFFLFFSFSFVSFLFSLFCFRFFAFRFFAFLFVTFLLVFFSFFFSFRFFSFLFVFFRFSVYRYPKLYVLILAFVCVRPSICSFSVLCYWKVRQPNFLLTAMSTLAWARTQRKCMSLNM